MPSQEKTNKSPYEAAGGYGGPVMSRKYKMKFLMATQNYDLWNYGNFSQNYDIMRLDHDSS